MQEYWENRYQTGDTRWDKGAPSPGLVDFLASHPNLTKGSVCVPGCGSGHDVRAFAAAGFEAWGLDFAPSAVRWSIESTRKSGLTATFRQMDFLRDAPPKQFDWLFEHTLFCAIQPGERSEYLDALLRWLKPGGYYLSVFYFIPDEDGPPFGVARPEILERFGPHLEILEEWVPRSYENRTGLERMFWWQRPGARLQ
jgi:SAM-dependent methyltransferase